jgi:hypothetical protein
MIGRLVYCRPAQKKAPNGSGSHFFFLVLYTMNVHLAYKRDSLAQKQHMQYTFDCYDAIKNKRATQRDVAKIRSELYAGMSYADIVRDEVCVCLPGQQSSGLPTYLCCFHNAVRYIRKFELLPLREQLLNLALRQVKEDIWPGYRSFLHEDAPILIGRHCQPLAHVWSNYTPGETGTILGIVGTNSRPNHPDVITAAIHSFNLRMQAYAMISTSNGPISPFDLPEGDRYLIDSKTSDKLSWWDWAVNLNLGPLLRMAMLWWVEYWQEDAEVGPQDWHRDHIMELGSSRYLATTKRSEQYAFRGDLTSPRYEGSSKAHHEMVHELLNLRDQLVPNYIDSRHGRNIAISSNWAPHGEYPNHLTGPAGSYVYHLSYPAVAEIHLPKISKVVLAFQEFVEDFVCRIGGDCHCRVPCPFWSRALQLSRHICAGLRWQPAMDACHRIADVAVTLQTAEGSWHAVEKTYECTSMRDRRPQSIREQMIANDVSVNSRVVCGFETRPQLCHCCVLDAYTSKGTMRPYQLVRVANHGAAPALCTGSRITVPVPDCPPVVDDATAKADMDLPYLQHLSNWYRLADEGVNHTDDFHELRPMHGDPLARWQLPRPIGALHCYEDMPHIMLEDDQMFVTHPATEQDVTRAKRKFFEIDMPQTPNLSELWDLLPPEDDEINNVQ